MGKHNAPAEPADSRSRTVRDRRPGPKHSSPESKPRTPRKTAKAAPSSAPPASSAPSSSPGPDTRSRAADRAERAAAVGRGYADRAALKASMGGKPSVSGSAVSGAAGGAATGAALGSVVPGIGTAAGAVGGAVVGGTGGAISGGRKKKAYKRATAAAPGARRIIVTEFAICSVIVALSPLTDRRRDDKPGDWMKRMTAVCLLFFILALISSAGRGPAKVAAGFGGLVALALVLSERDLFAKLASIFNDKSGKAAAGTRPVTEEEAAAAGEAAAGALGDIVTEAGL